MAILRILSAFSLARVAPLPVIRLAIFLILVPIFHSLR